MGENIILKKLENENIQNIQNMNYGNLIYNKKINVLFIYFFIFTKRQFRIKFGIVCVFCTINCHFKFGIQIRCIFLYIGAEFKDIF